MGAKRAQTTLASFPPKPGDVIAEKYVVERVLGQGGMGMVISAHHVHLDQRVAMKFLLPHGGEANHAAISRFLREARAAARIQSEHVGRVLDVGTIPEGSDGGGAPFIVMEYLDGLDLAALLKSRGTLPIEEAVEYVLQACEAIAEAHSIGIVHRDLKPSNLFLARRKDASTSVKLIDFGIAKAPEQQAWSEGALTGTGGTMGSPQYMSPEHVRSTSEVDARTDIWALGVILHELVSGRLPFEAATPAALCAMIAADAPTPLRTHRPEAPELLEAAILRCLEKRPSARYQTIAELAQALSPLAPSAARISIERVTKLATTMPSIPGLAISGETFAASGSGPIVLQGDSRRSSPEAVSAPTLARTDTAWQSVHLPAPMRLRSLLVIAIVGTALLTTGIFLTTRTHESPRSTASTGSASETATTVQSSTAATSAIVTVAPQAASSTAATAATTAMPPAASSPKKPATIATTKPAGVVTHASVTAATTSTPPVPPPTATATSSPTTTGGGDDDPIGSRK